ncbi:MAG: hypothetical protein RLY86_4473, partial [Pseudomonadota bacterium]
MDGGMVTRPAADKATGTTTGRLTIVGSGIKAIAHLTQEAIGHIRGADVVYYKVIDGATAAFLRSLNVNAIDLSQYYGDDKKRRVTYIQMAEVMLRDVRAGKAVVGVFYGHPGFFVDPARRALAVAAKEGYPAEMLAGVSSLDTMFADLRFDPAQHGCQIVEATDMLLRRRPIVTSGHVIVLQVGSVGDAMFNFAHGFRNNRRAVLFEHLIETYGPDHGSILYLGSTLPGVAPTLLRRKLSAYRDPAILASVPPACTLYIPPKDIRQTDPEMAEKMGAQWVVSPDAPRLAPLSEYGPIENAAVADLVNHSLSPHYRPPVASPAMLAVLTRLALEPEAQTAFARDPHGFAAAATGLTAAERAALLSGSSARLYAAMASGGEKAPGPKPAATPMSDTDIAVTPDAVPMSDTDIAVTPDAVPMSDTDIAVTPDAVPMSDTDIAVTPDAVPMSDTDIAVTPD